MARLDITLKVVVQCLYQGMFRRAELLRSRRHFNHRFHPVRASLTWYDAAGTLTPPTRPNLLRIKRLGGHCTFKTPQVKNDTVCRKFGKLLSICPVVLDGRTVCCGNWFLELELADIMVDPEARRTTALFIDPRCNLPLTPGVFDYATVKVLHATDPSGRSWVELKLEFGSQSFRIGGKNDMERANVQESIQLETMRSTDKVVARGYNRQKALLDPRVAAVLHYTAEGNVPVLRHAESKGRRSTAPTPSTSKQKGTIPTHP